MAKSVVVVSPRRRHRRRREEVSALLAEFAGSGLSARAFAASRGVAMSTFQAWRRQATDQPSRGKVASPVRLLPLAVPVGRSLADAPWLEVELVSGRVLRFARGITATEIAALCDALESPCSR